MEEQKAKEKKKFFEIYEEQKLKSLVGLNLAMAHHLPLEWQRKSRIVNILMEVSSISAISTMTRDVLTIVAEYICELPPYIFSCPHYRHQDKRGILTCRMIWYCPLGAKYLYINPAKGHFTTAGFGPLDEFENECKYFSNGFFISEEFAQVIVTQWYVQMNSSGPEIRLQFSILSKLFPKPKNEDFVSVKNSTFPVPTKFRQHSIKL